MSGRIEVTQAPSVPALFARAAATARGRGGELPDTRLAQAGVRVDPAQLAGWARVCGATLADTLPVTFPQVLTFGLQVALMSDRAFPFALPGLLHVRNRIEQLRPIGVTEVLELEVWADTVARHRAGATVDLCASVSTGGAEVWRGRSTHLAKGATAPAGAPAADLDVSVGALEHVSAEWQVPADTGRRYAAVSGDVNPIHLSGLTAKVFGFKRAIAHGAWVQARALAALSGRLPEAMAVDVAFRKPLPLPSTVTLSTAPAGGGWELAVRNASSGAEHLVGAVHPR